ncbi:MAG TPA: GNAT family N-acetyltransferase [Puia sp.]|nr:GNAT family N-acetyltransferase [Puia sp.]
MGIQQIQIVEVVLADLLLLQEISKRTFYDSFAALNTAENMKFHLDNHFTQEKLTAEILNKDSKFFFAIHDGKPVGYLKINQGAAQTVLPNDQAIEIERIYVDRLSKGNGIGKTFISKAIVLANTSQAKYLWLGVWEQNEPAIRFYEKNGFKKFSEHIFELGDDEQTDLLMKKTLRD